MTKKKMSFEEAIERLEEINRILESGEADLAESLKLYEEGVSLIRSCSDLLQKAEQSVKMLQLRPDGTAELTDFGKEED